MSSYHLLESMGFGTGIYNRVAKMREVTLLVEIVCLHKCTKNLLKYVQKSSKYWHLVAIPVSATQGYFSRTARYKGCVDKITIHSSGGNQEKKVTTAQYLSNYLFKKYEDEAILDASQCGLTVSTSMNP